MIYTSYFYNILRENVTTFEEKHELEDLDQETLYEAVGVMSKGMLSKMGAKSINYGDIPNSKGRVEKFSGFKNMRRTIDILLRSNDSDVKDMAETVDRALSNLVSLSDIFVKAFKVENKFIQLFYNNYVYAALQSTSYIICYIDGSHKLLDNKCIKNLQTLNSECNNGNVRQIMREMLNGKAENFLGGIASASTAIAKSGIVASGGGFAGGAAIALVLAATIIPLTRELIYLFYSTKSKISDFLAQQAKFVEISIDNEDLESNLSIDKKNKIAENKKNRVKTLRNLSDKLAVSYAIADRDSTKELAGDNKTWTLDEVKKDITDNPSGIQLI